MRLGYNTNGFAHHRLEDALHILADLGYASVALTLDYGALNPYDPDHAGQRERIRQILEMLQLHCVIETGARFLLDPWRKHQPTLLSAEPGERERRLDFLRRSVELAQFLKADAVSFWSGTPIAGATEDDCWRWLIDGCRRLCDEAARRDVRLAFEPEPGMFIDTMPKFAELHARVAHPSFGLTLDLGHLHCQGEISPPSPAPIAEQSVIRGGIFPSPPTPLPQGERGESIRDHLNRWRAWLWNIHIEDMRRGVHDHLMFGEGEMDFPPIFAALREIGYAGGMHVELSRHSHDAVQTARKAMAFLQECAACDLAR